MLVHCPACGLIFRVRGGQIAADGGQVICRECKTAFLAPANQLAATFVPDAQDTSANEDLIFTGNTQEIGRREVIGVRYAGSAQGKRPLEKTVCLDPSANIPSAMLEREHALPEALKLAAPATGVSETVRSTHGTRWWLAGNVLMCLILLLQVIEGPSRHWFNASPALVAVSEAVCGAIGCKAPLAVVPELIKLEAPAIVGSHPAVDGALLVKLTLVNTAPVRQVFPLIELTLFGQGNRIAGQRRFYPEEYLDTHYAVTEGLAPGTSTTVNIELRATELPPERYEFRFL